ncbi:MAG: hypothetical protein LUF90_08320 [Rikenellaceae bacterium]|nr:hypothetical protein [Rikenellaceae bacterium]
MAEYQTDNSLKGYKIIVIILAVVLAALTYLYFTQVRELKGDRQELMVQRDTLVNRLTGIMIDFDSLKTENDTISANLILERQRADSILQKLQQERSLSYAKINQYEKELGTLRTIMQNYVRQIDSLNTLNQTLIQENLTYRRNETQLRLRAEMAEERATELDIKVQQGSVILARNISLLALNKNDKEVTRANRAERLRTDFVLTANELATPGDRTVYIRIVGPDGYLLANSSDNVFDYEGERIAYSASRSVDYQNDDLGVGIYYNGSGITSGKYSVSVYMDGKLIGSNEIILK